MKSKGNLKRVISLVPSWTETLLEAGVDVVGRTRYCLHPSNQVKDIPIVGGTKNADWLLIARLAPDFVIMDREENTKEMAELCPTPVLATHVESLSCVAAELENISSRLCCDSANDTSAEKLRELALRWRNLRPSRQQLQSLPGLVKWVNEPVAAPEKYLYLIWRDPWMAVGGGTFIQSIFAHMGLAERRCHLPATLSSADKYPQVDLADFDTSTTLLLFSTEPYPFAKKVEELRALSFSSALVDGECFSWFGIRSLRFLESV